MPLSAPRADAARARWQSARDCGSAAERAASSSVDVATARAALRANAQELGLRDATGDPVFLSLRARIASCPHSIFLEWTRDAATAFGDADAATMMFEPIAAFIEGIKIVDDIQDDEPSCLATDVGVARAMRLASGAHAIGLEVIAGLPLPDASWRAAAVSLGRGLRETAIGQELETTAPADFDAFWNVVDRKTVPLVATALECGALAAGATPRQASALTALALPMGRLLQIGDDCIDALTPTAADWRAPRNNLLMLYSLCGPRGAELEPLLARASDPDALRAAQVLLLRDGALAYALHAQLTLLAQFRDVLDSLALTNPEPFHLAAAKQRAECEKLLRKSGVSEELVERQGSAWRL